MGHQYKTKLSKHGGRTKDGKRCFLWRVWLWKPGNNVKKYPYWSIVSESPTKAEAEKFANEILAQHKDSAP